MSDTRFTDELAVRAMGWRIAPGRYLKAGGGWTPRSRFKPLADIRDAFRVLDVISTQYLIQSAAGKYTVVIHTRGCIARATSSSKARAIALAAGQALGIRSEAEG